MYFSPWQKKLRFKNSIVDEFILSILAQLCYYFLLVALVAEKCRTMVIFWLNKPIVQDKNILNVSIKKKSR